MKSDALVATRIAMRMALALLSIGLLTACIPRGSDRREPPRADARSPSTVQCHVDLARERIGFRVLPDRRFERGCSAIGTVQLTEISTPVTNLGAMTCPLAQRFARWAREEVAPAARRILDTDVRRIETFGTYSCRGVNGDPNARLSEHAFSNAVDVSAFVLGDGRRITVLDHWNGGEGDVRRFLRAVHQGGCRSFSITLGPDANRFHANHFHFDMGRGPYCR